MTVSRSSLLKVFRAWLALELSAAILALSLLVMLLPIVVLTYPGVMDAEAPTWAIVVDILSLSIPLGIILGRAAIEVAFETA